MFAGDNLLQTANLHLKAGERMLVTSLNWIVQPGQCWCVIGRNGAGKSTLLQALVGIGTPTSGMVHLKGIALSDWPLLALARERAFLPQSRNDAFGYRVIESVLTARHPFHSTGYWDSEEDYEAAYTTLQAVGVDHLAARDIRTLSGGERQRVAIAAVLAQNTPLLLLDEPANALDLGHQASVMALLSQLCEKSGKTVIMVSHDMNLAHSVATHALLLMGDGRWHAGPVAEVMQAPLLSACLGHPIEAVQHGERIIFIPGKETLHE